MEEKYYNVYEALEILKENIPMRDIKNNFFYLNKDKINVRGNNASYVLEIDDFLKVHEKNKFILEEDDAGIDPLKDEEYYSFKHK